MRLSRSLLAAALCAAFCLAPAQAARPSDAQIDQLMESMNYERMKREIVQQMRGSAEMMAQAATGDRLTAEQRASLARITEKQMASIERLLEWKQVAPIYRKVYGDVFEAAEVQAMIDFYRTPAGKSILEKMPLAMGRTMQEMQPLMARLFEDLRRELQRDMQSLIVESGEHAGHDHGNEPIVATVPDAPPAPPAPPAPKPAKDE